MITINTEWIGYINILVIVLYAVCILRGAKKGVFVQILSSLGLIVSFLGAWRYCRFASTYYDLWPKDLVPMSQIPDLAKDMYSHLNQIIWFVLLLVIFRLLFMILEKLCSGLSGLPVIKEISSLLGAGLGAVSATIWVLVICTVMNLPIIKNGRKAAEGSLLGTITSFVSDKLEEFSAPVIASETLADMYDELKDMDNKDIDMIEDWLSEHGIEKTEEAAEKSDEVKEETAGTESSDAGDEPEAAKESETVQ